MTDIEQWLARLDSAVVGAPIGAALTYLTSALNRRHQEEREDKTRWYNTQVGGVLGAPGHRFP
jgi:hypothetical protein